MSEDLQEQNEFQQEDDDDDNQSQEFLGQQEPQKIVNKNRINTNFQCMKSKKLKQQQNMILDDLQLNVEVVEERSQVVLLQSSKIIKKNFSIETQLRLLKVAETVQIRKNELIIVQNELDDCSLYLIKEGTIELFLSYRNKQNQIIKRNTFSELKSNQSFGEYSFFSGRAPMAGARAIQDSELIKITRQNLLMIFNEFPIDQEKYFEINHQLLNNRFECLQLSCYFCGSQKHLALKCSRLIYTPDREGVILRYLQSNQNSELYFERNNNSKLYPTLVIINQINKIIKKFREENIQLDQQDQFDQLNQQDQLDTNSFFQGYQLDIDQIRTYTKYEPNYNSSVVIKKYNNYLERQRVQEQLL